ncbi:MAG: DUF6946 family protein [Bryobacteraceae bacterium]
MEKGEPGVPAELLQLLDSHQATSGAVVRSGITEHETILPFGNRGAHCHDLALQAEHGGVMTICIEAKADESFRRHCRNGARESEEAACNKISGTARLAHPLTAWDSCLHTRRTLPAFPCDLRIAVPTSFGHGRNPAGR